MSRTTSSAGTIDETIIITTARTIMATTMSDAMTTSGAMTVSITMITSVTTIVSHRGSI